MVHTREVARLSAFVSRTPGYLYPSAHARGPDKYYRNLFEKHTELTHQAPKPQYLYDEEAPAQAKKRQRVDRDAVLLDRGIDDAESICAVEDVGGDVDIGACGADDASCSSASSSLAADGAAQSCMPDAPSQLAAAQAPPLVQPQRDVVPIAQAQRGREGEWEMWFSHRFTKVKRNKLWTGWQCVCVCVCGRHTDPAAGQSAKCNRSRTFRGVTGLDHDDPAFLVENDRVLTVLRHWVVSECGPNTKSGHMLVGDVGDDDFMPDDILSTAAMLCMVGHRGADVSPDDERRPSPPPQRSSGSEARASGSGAS